MPLDFTDKVALITGAGNGIGRATPVRPAARGPPASQAQPGGSPRLKTSPPPI